jgi:hypothetical protein
MTSHPGYDPREGTKGVVLHPAASGTIVPLHEFAHHLHQEQEGVDPATHWNQGAAPASEHSHGYDFVHHFRNLLGAAESYPGGTKEMLKAFDRGYGAAHQGIFGSPAPQFPATEHNTLPEPQQHTGMAVPHHDVPYHEPDQMMHVDEIGNMRSEYGAHPDGSPILMKHLRDWDSADMASDRHEPEDLDDLVEDVRQHGVKRPLHLWRNAEGEPSVWDGHHRYWAATRAGLTHVPVRWSKSAIDDEGEFDNGNPGKTASQQDGSYEDIADEAPEEEIVSEASWNPYDLITTAGADPDFRFHVTAAWADVQRKAKRIRAEGGVRITLASDGVVFGEV